MNATLSLVCALAVASVARPAVAQDLAESPEPAARGLVRSEPEAFEGYTLLAPMRDEHTYLIDMEGNVVHRWAHDTAPGLSAYLLDDGSLLRCARVSDATLNSSGLGGRIQRFSWDGALEWDYALSDACTQAHHDVEPLPNGNVLAIVWTHRDPAEAIEAGRDPDAVDTERGLWTGSLLEIRPVPPEGGEVVWEWHAWDHRVQDLDPAKAHYSALRDRQRRIDLNGDHRPGGSPRSDTSAEELERIEAQMRALGYAGDDEPTPAPVTDTARRSRPPGRPYDWLHLNAVSYSPERDLILLSSRSFSEVWVIDHSTTTAEAARSSGGTHGRGGDLLYRWGNPRMFGGGDETDRVLFMQHDPRWIEAASAFTVFNNGTGREDAYSSVEEVVLPFDAKGRLAAEDDLARGPASARWTWTAEHPGSFYAPTLSGAQRLPNGNTLACHGPGGRLVEVTRSGRVVWEYWSPFRSARGRRAEEARDADPNRPARLRSASVRWKRPDLAPPPPPPPRPGDLTRTRGSRAALFRATRLRPDHPGLQRLP